MYRMLLLTSGHSDELEGVGMDRCTGNYFLEVPFLTTPGGKAIIDFLT